MSYNYTEEQIEQIKRKEREKERRKHMKNYERIKEKGDQAEWDDYKRKGIKVGGTLLSLGGSGYCFYQSGKNIKGMYDCDEKIQKIYIDKMQLMHKRGKRPKNIDELNGPTIKRLQLEKEKHKIKAGLWATGGAIVLGGGIYGSDKLGDTLYPENKRAKAEGNETKNILKQFKK